jgi:hypothetical protein
MKAFEEMMIKITQDNLLLNRGVVGGVYDVGYVNVITNDDATINDD